MSNFSYSSSEMYDSPPLWNSCLFGGGGGTQCVFTLGHKSPSVLIFTMWVPLVSSTFTNWPIWWAPTMTFQNLIFYITSLSSVTYAFNVPNLHACKIIFSYTKKVHSLDYSVCLLLSSTPKFLIWYKKC